jgi:hypothetical protein
MAVHRVRAAADADGRLTAWHQQIVAAPTAVNLPFLLDVLFTNGVDFFTTMGAVDPPYGVENFRLESTNFESRVPTMVWVLDCGRKVNPDLIRAQVEGGLLWGLSAAAWDEVILGDGGEIVTQNFDRYPVMRMRSVPDIEVHLIDSTEPPTGVGEVSVPMVAPALANAIAALTGTRIRELPFSKTIKIY